MKAKDVVRAAAEALRLTDARDFCDGKNTVQSGGEAKGEAEANRLLEFFNATETDVAASAVPLIKDESVSAAGKIDIAALSENFVRALRFTDKNGCRAAFSEEAGYVRTDASAGVLRYAYLPAAKAMDDESDFKNGVPMKVFLSGVLAKYYFDKQLFEEAAVYEKEYKAAAAVAHRIASGGKMRARRWR